MLLFLVEDDAALRGGLTDVLRQSGHEVETALDGRAALSALLERDFDLAILDLGLPGMDGLEIVRALRRREIAIPVLIITARDRLNERVTGLDTGADDYLIKPFEIPEFEARVRALLRRYRGGANVEVRVGPLRFIPGQPRVTVGDVSIELVSGELALLELLAQRPGSSVSKAKIAARLARSGERPTNTAIEVCMHRLRRKLLPFGVRIRALRGFGYVLEADSHC